MGGFTGASRLRRPRSRASASSLTRARSLRDQPSLGSPSVSSTPRGGAAHPVPIPRTGRSLDPSFSAQCGFEGLRETRSLGRSDRSTTFFRSLGRRPRSEARASATRPLRCQTVAGLKNRPQRIVHSFLSSSNQHRTERCRLFRAEPDRILAALRLSNCLRISSTSERSMSDSTRAASRGCIWLKILATRLAASSVSTGRSIKSSASP